MYGNHRKSMPSFTATLICPSDLADGLCWARLHLNSELPNKSDFQDRTVWGEGLLCLTSALTVHRSIYTFELNLTSKKKKKKLGQQHLSSWLGLSPSIPTCNARITIHQCIKARIDTSMYGWLPKRNLYTSNINPSKSLILHPTFHIM